MKDIVLDLVDEFKQKFGIGLSIELFGGVTGEDEPLLGRSIEESNPNIYLAEQDKRMDENNKNGWLL